MMNIKILIVEDKSVLAYDLVDRLNNFGYQNVLGPFATGEEAYKKSQEELPDVALLDISLGGEMDGIQLARKLNKKGHVPIIYLTQHQDDRILKNTLSTFPVAFINKPFTNNELRMALINAIKAKGQPTEGFDTDSEEMEAINDRIFIRNGRGKIQLLLSNILWIQSGGGETSSIITKERHQTGKVPIPVTYNLNKMAQKLAFHPDFIRCSRFHIVNLRAVDRIFDDPGKIKQKKVLLVYDEEIGVGEKYRKEVMKRLHVL